MAVVCQPNALGQAAACMSCLPAQTHLEVQTYLLALIAGKAPDPNALAQAAKEFQKLPATTLQEIQVYLLCQILNAVSP